MNKRFCEAVGIPESAFLQTENLPDLVGEEMATSCLASDRACFAQEAPYVSIEMHKLVDGKLHQLEVTKTKLRDTKGGLVGASGISVDVTERILAEEALRESEARWSFALEGGGDCVWDWDLQTNDVSLSKGGKGMFGFADNEIGNSMSEWNARVHPEDVARLMVQIGEFFHKKQDKFTAEYRVRCKDGSWKWILARGLVVNRAADGKPLRMIGLTRLSMSTERSLQRFLSTVAGVVLAAALAGPLQAQDAAIRRTLGQHTFLPSALLGDPFAGTSVRNLTGGGTAVGLQVPKLNLDGDVVEYQDANIGFLTIGMEYQQAVTRWLALRAGFTGGARIGTSGIALLSEGITAQFGGTLGATARLVRTDRLVLSATADVLPGVAYQVSIFDYIKDVVDNGFENANSSKVPW